MDLKPIYSSGETQSPEQSKHDSKHMQKNSLP